jgi:hypothetical protein
MKPMTREDEVYLEAAEGWLVVNFQSSSRTISSIFQT